MIYYTSDGRQFEGMSLSTIEALLAQLDWSGTFVTKEEYDSYIASLPRGL